MTKEGKKLHIIDQGLGMTAEEVEKYINQIAFSGAEEFLAKIQGFCQRFRRNWSFWIGILFGFHGKLLKLKSSQNHTKTNQQRIGPATEVGNSH